MAAMLANTLACVSTTPFGSPVEPEENWMKAVWSGATAARSAACSTAGGSSDSAFSARRSPAAASPLFSK